VKHKIQRKYRITIILEGHLNWILTRGWQHTVAYSLKARIVESQQPIVTRKQSVNNNRGMVFSVQSVPMAEHTIEYVMPSVSNNCTATEEWCFLLGPCRYGISRIS
jgi:hypothetical protein